MIRSGGVCDHMHVYVVRMHVCRCVCIVHMFDACGHTYIHTYIHAHVCVCIYVARMHLFVCALAPHPTYANAWYDRVV
jgi:hypothetical protein